MLFFQAFQPQHCILRGAELVSGSGQLEFHLVVLPLSLLQLRIRHQLVLLQLFFLGIQLFQFISPGQNARFLIHAAAGHGAAGIHHLAVQGDDAEPVAVFLGHGNGSIHVVNDHGSAQQILHDLTVSGIRRHQLGGNAHEAPAAFQAIFLESFALDGI